VAECQKAGASVSLIVLDNGLNANMLRRWINEAQRADNEPSTPPAIVPAKLPAATTPVVEKHHNIRIETSPTSAGCGGTAE
jgi:transposase-like protein